ncbi:MAG: redox-sensitive transcriptional activator SoxR, partial [Sulfitobacter sp.]
DWTRISEGFRAALDARIATLNKLRDNLDGCIGCGCLSLEACALYNPIDQAGEKGPGPRYLMGDEPAA